MHRLSFLPLLTLLTLANVPRAEDLGGGRAASHGRVPRLVLTKWIPGQASELRFVDMPPGVVLSAVLISTGRTSVSLPFGTVIADPAAPGAVSLALSAPLPIMLPAVLAATTLYIQGVYLEPAGLGLTDATRVDFFNPVVVVGNQRQSSNSLSLIDLTTRTVTQTIGNSENGSIAFSRNRRYAYVCEPGLQRNRVAVYDLSTTPVTTLTPIPVSGGIRYEPTVSPDGKRMYVPIHTGVSVIDVDQTSATFHIELFTIPTPITGASGSIFTGPFDLAVTPDGTRLVVCYGEQVISWQVNPGTLGVIDLTQASFPHTAIPLTNSGAFTGLGQHLISRSRVEVSPDGRYAYAVEFAFKPGSPLVSGFANGGAIHVVDLILKTETAAVPFGGYAVHELALDRNGRNLWVAANNITDLGYVTRFDVDRNSATQFSILKQIQVDPLPYPAGGAFGINVTPDGALVCVSLCEDGSHPTPLLVTIDAWTDALFGTGIPVQSLPATVGIPRF